MNCFVIMPFAEEFDDVYAAIKSSVESALGGHGTCSRLDESRPAGRITDRLLGEIQSATLCVVDVTGNRPNVMWELGYAMALGKPTILVTQNLSDLPFDIRDLQTLSYDRNHISRTLGRPLARMVLDTLSTCRLQTEKSDRNKEREDLVGALLGELQSLKGMLGDAVRAWAPGREFASSSVPNAASILEGSWRNPMSRSHFYAKVVRGELVVPYCYQGNDNLTGVYFDWKKTGDHWFARFGWLWQPIKGFAFLKQKSLDVLTGAWWYEHQVDSLPSVPPTVAGVQERWERLTEGKIPEWASHFLDQVDKTGLDTQIRRMGKPFP